MESVAAECQRAAAGVAANSVTYSILIWWLNRPNAILAKLERTPCATKPHLLSRRQASTGEAPSPGHAARDRHVRRHRACAHPDGVRCPRDAVFLRHRNTYLPVHD